MVDPADVVLDGTTVQPASAGISIDGQVVSADAANDLFVDGTEILAQPTSSTLTSSTASLSSSNITFSGSASVSSVTADAANLGALGGEIAHLAVQVASSLAIQSAGDAGDISVSASTSLVTASSQSSTPPPLAMVLSASSAMTSSSLSRTSSAEAIPNVQTTILQSQSGSSAPLSILGSTLKSSSVLTGFPAAIHSNSSSGLYAVSGASNMSQSASSSPQSMNTASTLSNSAVLVPGAQPNTITTGPTLAISTTSLLPTGSVASSQAVLLVGAIFGITEEAKTLSAIIKDDGPKESFISKIKETDDDILNFLEDIDPPDPPPSYDDACLDGASILNIEKDLGCLKGAFDKVISDLKDEPPDVNKIQITFDNIGNLARNLEKEEDDDDDDDDETSASETNSQASKSQDSATDGSSTSMSSTTPSMTSAALSRISSSASTATASMQPLVIDRYPIADPDTSNYSTPDISDQALMAFLGDVLSSEVGVGPGPSGFAVVSGSAKATASLSSLTLMSSTPTTVRTSSSALAASSAVAGTGSSNIGGAIVPVAGAETASSQVVLASAVTSLSSALPSNTSAGFAALGEEIAQIAYNIALTSNSILAASTAAANAGAVGGEIAGLAAQIASASAVSLSAANVALPSPVTSSSLAPSILPSPPPTGPKWGIYLGYQIYTWGGPNAMTDFYYKIWITDLTTNPGGPDFCASKSWIANVQINGDVVNVPPYPTEDFKFVIPAKTVGTVAVDCMWQPSVGNSQPGSMTCDPGETVLCTTPTMPALMCKNDNPDRILPLSQCVWQ